jgi:hypothetical protein
MHISSKLTTSIAAALAFSTFGAIGVLPAEAEPISCDNWCHAPTPGESISSARSETFGFVGLRWNFGAKSPALTAGVRYTHTDTDNSVLGAKFDVSVDLKKDFTFTPTVRLLGLAGNREIQAELGLGLQSSDWQWLVAGGLQIPHLNAGANYTLAGELTPYIEVNSLGRPTAPNIVRGYPSCFSNGDPYQVIDGTITVDKFTYLVGDADVVDGFTCFSAP